MERTAAPRQVAILLYPGVQSLDVTGPLEVFTAAARLISAGARCDRGYEVRTFSRDGLALKASSGLTITPDGSLTEAPVAIDTLIVPGGRGSREAAEDGALIEWISGSASVARRTAGVCTGAFLLAAAGLLDGRRATTHWAAAQELARRHPEVQVDPEPIFLRDGSTWTSAGVTAGMDLALALVEEDLDRDAALQIARHLVLFLRRPGNQSQFSATLAAQQPGREPLREVQHFVVEHVAADALGGGDGRPRPHEPAPLRPRLPRRDGRDAGPLRRARTPGGRSPAAGGQRRSDRGGRLGLRLRNPRDDAPGVPARARGRARGVPAALSIPGRLLACGMNIAILIYDRFTALDAIGPYEVLSRLPGANLAFVAAEPGPVRTDNGVLEIVVEHSISELPSA